jgi:hypothetical protein
MVEGLDICARDLVLAVFRLAVADHLGICYGHDEPGPNKRTKGNFHAEAADFLLSPWATHLADLAGFSVHVVWQEAQRQRLQDVEQARAA